MAASREPGTRASAPTRGRGGWRGRAAKAAVSVLPLLFTAAAFLSESPLEPFGPGHARRFSAAPGFDQRFTDFSDRSGPPGRSAGSADASDCRTLRHRLALLRRRPRVRGSAREDSRSDPADPARFVTPARSRDAGLPPVSDVRNVPARGRRDQARRKRCWIGSVDREIHAVSAGCDRRTAEARAQIPPTIGQRR